MRPQSRSNICGDGPLRLRSAAGASLAFPQPRHALRLGLILAAMAMVPMLGSLAARASRPITGQADMAWRMER